MASGHTHDLLIMDDPMIDQGIAGLNGKIVGGSGFFIASDEEAKSRARDRLLIKQWCDIPIKESGV